MHPVAHDFDRGIISLSSPTIRESFQRRILLTIQRILTEANNNNKKNPFLCEAFLLRPCPTFPSPFYRCYSGMHSPFAFMNNSFQKIAFPRKNEIRQKGKELLEWQMVLFILQTKKEKKNSFLCCFSGWKFLMSDWTWFLLFLHYVYFHLLFLLSCWMNRGIKQEAMGIELGLEVCATHFRFLMHKGKGLSWKAGDVFRKA